MNNNQRSEKSAMDVKEQTQINPSINISNVDYNRVYLYNDLSFGIPAHFNRDINQGQVKKIYNGLLNGEDWRIGEIYVDIETKEIIDGNHRYAAIEKYILDGNKLKAPVRVLYKKRPEGISVAKAVNLFNSDRKQWGADDHAKSMIKQGDKFVCELEEFCLKNYFLHKKIVNKKTGSVIKKPIFRYGGWVIKGCNCSPLLKKNIYQHTASELETAQVVYDEIEQMLTAIGVKRTGTWFGEFVAAWKLVREEQKTQIASLKNGFQTLIPIIKTGNYINENNLVNQLEGNKYNLKRLIAQAIVENN